MRVRPARTLLWLAIAAVLAAAVVLSGAAPAVVNIGGFSAALSAAEARWERSFQASIQPARLRADMRTLSAAPHNAGSARQQQLAGWILQQFQADGFQAHLEPFDVLYPTPIARRVELVAPHHFVAGLKEPEPDAAGALPTFLMYSADGDVTAPLVYVNYGVAADYATLNRLGVSVRGKIVIARYGQGWRGIKPRLAYEHGAVGCLLYSDPQDDGFARGAVYPRGPWRPAEGVQRGSVMEMTLAPGDPETPGWGSTPGAPRLPLAQVTNLQKIPVLPLSYADAGPLLAALGGPAAPPSWRGALPLTYRIGRLGPGTAVVHLAVKFHWGLARINDVIATIPGSTDPEAWILRGNHYDAWVDGADDPGSGQAALLEEARGLGALLRQGWRPRRTIVYAAWDGEEPSLLGSTEWVETHAAELNEHAVAYLNTDMSQAGQLRVGGSQTLEAFMNGVLRAVPDPSGAGSEGDAGDLTIRALGSGSDYSPFLDHLGIAALDLGFEGGGGGGVYHSALDNFYWYTHFSDPKFLHERALAQTVGTAVLRLADADVLPFEFSGFAAHVAHDERQVEAAYHAQPHANGVDFKPLRAALGALKRAAIAYDQALAARPLSSGGGSRYAALNRLLAQSERQLLEPAGLPGRSWYRHQIYAPGLNTGYSAITLPGLREAIAAGDEAAAEKQTQALTQALAALTRQIQAARADL